MRAIVSTWTYFIVIRYAFILGVVHQSTTYELKESAYCEWYCTKVQQQWDNSCPVYGSCRWYCQTKRKDCILGTRYHCARDLHNKDLFIEACAAEIFCLAEPQISLHQSGKAIVFCLPCHRRNRYNGRHNTSSAVFSECLTIKTNLCVETEHKVDCDKTSFWNLTKTDGYCRCDANNGYAAQSKEMCFYENERCFRKKCPAGNVLSLNYTCVKECPVGFAQDEYDNCNTLKSPHPENASVFSTVTTVAEDKETHLSTENPPNESRPNKRLFEVVVTLASLLTAAFIVLFFVKQKKDIRRKRQDIQSPIEKGPFLIHENPNRESEVIIEAAVSMDRDYGAHLTVAAVTETRDIPVHAKPSHDISTAESDSEGWLGQTECADVYRRFPQEGFIDIVAFDFDNLKDWSIIEPTSWPKIHAIDVHGFKAYEKPSGKGLSIYEMISYLLCGNDRFMFILRLAAARYAQTHFETYVTKLTNTFDDCYKANVFFKAHGITLDEKMKWPKHKRDCVSDAFNKLVREAVHEGKGNAPFYIEFLSGVLNRKIHQHFEEETYDGRKVDTIAGLNVSLTTDDSSDRELHVYWMKSKDLVKETPYWIFPLLKCVQNCLGMELCQGIYKFLKNENVFEEDTCLDFINTSNIFEFDQLKEKGIIKTETTSMRTIHTIQVEGFTAYEMPGDETSCMYEFMSYMLFGNADMKYIMRLAAMRYALQNFWQYVNKLTGEFGKGKSVSSKVNDAKLFFEIHSIEFKETESSSMEKCVLMSFTDLVREIANTGQGPFYLEFFAWCS